MMTYLKRYRQLEAICKMYKYRNIVQYKKDKLITRTGKVFEKIICTMGILLRMDGGERTANATNFDTSLFNQIKVGFMGEGGGGVGG